MSKITANIFSEFEKSLLKNMQELEIMKSQKAKLKRLFIKMIVLIICMPFVVMIYYAFVFQQMKQLMHGLRLKQKEK